MSTPCGSLRVEVSSVVLEHSYSGVSQSIASSSEPLPRDGKLKGWSNILGHTGLHLVPPNDITDHCLSPKCLCGPTWSRVKSESVLGPLAANYFIHHAMDGRE